MPGKPSVNHGVKRGIRIREHAESLLQAVGLSNRIDYLPHQLSIGQQQRVAVARALVNRPKLVLADEPTGNLDPDNTDRSLELLRSLCEEWGSALLLVSHDPRVVAQFEKQIDWEEINEVKNEAISKLPGLVTGKKIRHECFVQTCLACP